MSRIFALLLLIFLWPFLLTACGSTDTQSAGNDSVSSQTVYSGDIEDKGESLRYELYINDDGTCEFNQYYLNECHKIFKNIIDGLEIPEE